jgi:photosystem II stability/assembly factor-like uncharacterized protein
MRNFLAISFLFLFVHQNPASNDLQISSYRWSEIGPKGGFVSQIERDPNQPNVWYSITNGSLYRSNDWGKSWNKLFEHVRSVSVHPKTSEVIVYGYVETNRRWRPRLLRGGKAGRAWTTTPINWFDRIDWDPNKTTRLLGVAQYRFWESNDSGKTWKGLGKFYGSNDDCWFSTENILISPFDNRTIYLNGDWDCEYLGGGYETKVSTDGGRTWKTSANSAGNVDSNATNSESIFSANCQNVLQLTSRGWKPVSDLRATLVTSVPGEPEHLFAFDGCNYGQRSLHESVDSGKTWKIAERLQSRVISLAVEDDPQKTVLVGSEENGIFRRAGLHWWKQSNQGFEPGEVHHITKSHVSKVIYGASSNYGTVIRKQENKTYWTHYFPGIPLHYYEYVHSLHVNPADPNYLYATTSDRVLVSRNGGRIWRKSLGLGVNAWIRDLTFDSLLNPKRVYLISNTILLASDDNGIHFKRVYANFTSTDYLYLIRTIVHPNDRRHVYVVSGSGIFKSTNSGESFQRIPFPNNKQGVDAGLIGETEDFLMITDEAEVYRKQGSADWTKISDLPLEYPWHFYRLRAADTTGRKWIAQLERYDSSFLESNDGGFTWSTIRLKNDIWIHDMTDPRFHPFYLATNQGVLMEK